MKTTREAMLEVWQNIDQDISGRLFDHPIYSLTAIRHGIRSRFNEYLGVDEELENEFQGRKPPSNTIMVTEYSPHPSNSL